MSRKKGARAARVMRQRATTPTRKSNVGWIVGGSVLAIVVVFALVWLSVNAATPAAAPKVSEGRVWGNVNAPVTIEIFSDFQ
jgi:hypothetical protein